MWKGVLIEESLTDTSILPLFTIVGTRTTTLEGEKDRGEFHFHNVEVTQEKLDSVVKEVSSKIKDAWYFHLVKDNEMLVIFHNKIFKAHKGNDEELRSIKQYGMSQGILEEQLGLTSLFDNPFV